MTPTPDEIDAGLHGLKLVAADVITDQLPESMWRIIVRVILEESEQARTKQKSKMGAGHEI